MRSAGLWLAVLALGGGCRHEDPPFLFESRVELAPLTAKLRDAGGDPARILRPARLEDLAPLATGKRYKFVVSATGRLAIAPLAADAPSNPYVHPVLAGGEAVRTAGGIRVDRKGDALARVTLDQDSKAYCPSADSLHEASRALVALGVPADSVRVENREPECSDETGGNRPRYGPLMADVGRRFERLGRAARAGRYELAAFEVDEIGEVFEGDLPRAELPRESMGVNLAGVADAFVKTNLPELDRAVKAHDAAAMARAYALAADTCNGCHKTSGHSFVEIPRQMGDEVPRLTPVTPPAH
jgi:hypothetical protein